ncbi:hypothetical protein B0H34DRAFT_772279 [Crassisporium funariophilum]|nr:hypothetical protein B0H34DRAFT_772279 [Crassisporium funariophilum]
MPSQSTLSSDEKAKVKNAIPTPSNKIIFAGLARIYYAYLQANKWSYAGLQGALALALDNTNNTYHFKMVDLDGTRGVIWDHELYQGLEYNQDRAFFHSFSGDKCMIGFVFADEGEAKTFYKKVNTKKDPKGAKARSDKKKKVAKGGKIDKSMISGPKTGSFRHVAHMGYDAESGFSSKGVDPSWTALLDDLEGSGVGKDDIARNMEFIKTFVREYTEETVAPKKPKKPKPPPPPSRSRHTANDSNGSTSSPISATPHAPPPPPSRAQNGPPLPPSRPPAPPARKPNPPVIAPRPTTPQTPQMPTSPPPPPRRPAPQTNFPPPPPARPPPIQSGGAPPPPPARPSTMPPRPPPPPARPTPASAHNLESSAPPPPPPPPPPPLIGGGGPPPPPPPPPPPTNGSASPSIKAALPPPQAGRDNLLASIQGKGIHSLKKTDPNATPVRANTASPPPDSGSGTVVAAAAIGAAAGGAAVAAGGGDLTSALAAALLERNKRLGDSDDDDDDDDEDWD